MRIITLLFMLRLMPAVAQIAIPGTINTSLQVPNVERNFIGFNSGQGNLESIYNFRGTGGMETNPYFNLIFNSVSNKITWRFPGGTTSNYYNRWGSGYGNSGGGQTFGDNTSYLTINQTLQNQIYGNYQGYTSNAALYPNSKSNVIFPFINSITSNKTVGGNAVFCLNIVNHYRSVPYYDNATYKTTPAILYDTRTEMLKDTNKIKAINNLTGNYLNAFNNSTLSAEFKKIVMQNIDAFLTMVNNQVTVYKIEMGNELYGYQYNDNVLVDYTAFINNKNQYSRYFPSDTKVWVKDDGTAQSIKDSYTSLWAYAHLAKLYTVLMRDTLQKLAAQQPGNPVYSNHLKNMKFGVPVTPTLTSGFRKWDEFMRQPNVKAYIGIDAYVMHPYLDSSNYFKGYNFTTASNASVTALTKEFNDIRDTLEIAYNNRFFKKNHVSLINAFPSGSEVWYTEWDFNFDNSKLVKVGNTLLHSMFYYDAMMNFFDINANKNLQVTCNKANPIKLCNYHIPYAKSITWYPMIRFSNGYATLLSDPSTTTNSIPNFVEYNATYFANLLLSPVLNDDSMIYLNTANGGFNAIPNCTFRTFYKKVSNSTCSMDNVYVYFNNKSATSYKIDLANALSLTNTQCVTATKNYLYANALFASMGQTTFRTDDIIYTDTLKNAADVTIQRVFNQSIAASTLNQVIIPKYSMGYVKVEITIPSASCTCTGSSLKQDNSSRMAYHPVADTIPEAETVSKEIPIAMAPPRIYPNPNTTGNLSLEVSVSKETISNIHIFDMTGSLVRSFTKELSAGQNTFQLDLSDLAKSIYIIRMEGEEINFSDKIILQ